MTIVRVLLPPSFPSLYAIHPPLSNDALTVALPGRLPPNLLPGWLAYHPPRAEVVLGPLHPHPPPGVGRLDNFAAEANAAEAHSHMTAPGKEAGMAAATAFERAALPKIAVRRWAVLLPALQPVGPIGFQVVGCPTASYQVEPPGWHRAAHPEERRHWSAAEQSRQRCAAVWD